MNRAFRQHPHMFRQPASVRVIILTGHQNLHPDPVSDRSSKHQQTVFVVNAARADETAAKGLLGLK